jgi:peptidoglycan/xylan/chitin deacetylase (PgdA/CDA1 family)
MHWTGIDDYEESNAASDQNTAVDRKADVRRPWSLREKTSRPDGRGGLLLRHLLKTISLPLLQASGVLRLARALDRQGYDLVLNYHNVSPRAFAAHAAFLRASKVEVVSLDHWLAARPRPFGPRVALTFDDGYAAFVDTIVPILETHCLPATWFVPTALVGTAEVLWFDRVRASVLHTRCDRVELQGRIWKLRDWSRSYVAAALTAALKRTERRHRGPEVEALLARLGEAPADALRNLRLVSPQALASLSPLVEVGSHSHTHPELSQLDEAEIAEELATSKRLLEQWTGRAVPHFAYPSGDHDGRVVAALRAVGYARGWTTEPRLRAAEEDPYRMPRIAIDDEAPVSVLSAKMTPLVHRLRMVS